MESMHITEEEEAVTMAPVPTSTFPFFVTSVFCHEEIS